MRKGIAALASCYRDATFRPDALVSVQILRCFFPQILLNLLRARVTRFAAADIPRIERHRIDAHFTHEAIVAIEVVKRSLTSKKTSRTA
jgi:hypothetical protein